MKKILLTGFDAFGGEKINPSSEAIKKLPDEIDGIKIEKLEIPTVYKKAAECVIESAEKILPDTIICVGQAGGRSAITPEVVAINLRESKTRDNAGVIYSGTPVVEDAPTAYFSTLPVRDIVGAIEAEGMPVSLSYSAGAFVCNDTLYRLLHLFHGSNVKVGFIHVPFLPEQAKDGIPSLSLEDITHALITAIKAIK